MKITIDTKEDSHVEIRKAIKLLMGLVGDKEVFTNEPETPSQGMLDSPAPDMGNMMSLFDTPETQTTDTTEKKEKSKLEFY